MITVQNYIKQGFILFFTLFAIDCFSQSILQVNSIDLPTQEQIVIEQQKIRNRVLNRYAVLCAASVGTYTVLHTAHEAVGYIKLAATNVQRGQAQSSVVASQIMQPSGWYTWMKNSALSFTGDMFSYAPQLVSGLFFNSLVEYCKNRWQHLFAEEHVIWYIDQHTKIWQIFADLKNCAVEYDIYSELLNIEVLNQDAKLHMKAFSDELIKVVKEREADELGDDSWFEVMFGGLKKKYAKHGLEIEKLEDIVIPHLAQRRRAEMEGFGSHRLFRIDDVQRQDIVDLCNLLTKEIQKTMAFVGTRTPVTSSKIQKMIDITNEYAQHVQQFVYMSSNEIEYESKAQRGIFTITYEFEKIFKDQVTHIYRYAKLI